MSKEEDDRVKSPGTEGSSTNEHTSETELLRVQNELLERRNELLEDQNALIYEAIQLYCYISYEPPELRYESKTPTPEVRDGLFELNYTTMHGSRHDGRPENDEDDR